MSDISHVVRAVSHLVYASRRGHLNAVYRILAYLKKSPGDGLLYANYANYANLIVEIYMDADWAASYDDRSTTDYC